MDFKEAVERLSLTKGRLLELAFGVGYSGIDSAIPQNYVNEHKLDTFWYATDCRKSCYEIVNLEEKISQRKKDAIIGSATLDVWMSELGIHYAVVQPLGRAFHEIMEEKE